MTVITEVSVVFIPPPSHSAATLFESPLPDLNYFAAAFAVAWSN
ncbi:hypothetical protein [Acinetobacter ursingii]|nr:hypothetical protein [Acinetobacter ursingii]